MEVITAAADTRAAATAMGVLFLEMMFRLEDEAIAKGEKRRARSKGMDKDFIYNKIYDRQPQAPVLSYVL